jgi:NAD(P)-dependent dehydrogenase (short-subunit alcohol dehydrogenase family)
MGRAMAIAFAEVGADLVLADINPAGNEATAHDIEQLGRRALPVTCDVSNVEQIRAMFARLDSEFGRIDVLGNVAGEGVRKKPLELTEEQVRQTLQNLVVGRFFCCQEAGQRMLAAGKGSIINIVSIGGINSLGRSHIAYGIAMAGVAQMTRELSTEWASQGVRTNAIVCAQVTNAGLQARMDADPNLAAAYLRGLPIGRLGRPDDIKGLAIFLASDASVWITGALIPLDGGNLAKNAGGSHPGMPGATMDDV